MNQAFKASWTVFIGMKAEVKLGTKLFSKNSSETNCIFQGWRNSEQCWPRSEIKIRMCFTVQISCCVPSLNIYIYIIAKNVLHLQAYRTDLLNEGKTINLILLKSAAKCTRCYMRQDFTLLSSKFHSLRYNLSQWAQLSYVWNKRIKHLDRITARDKN